MRSTIRRVRADQGGKDPHQGGLTGPVRPEKGEDAAPRHVEVHTAQHMQVPVRLLQGVHVDRRPSEGLGHHLGI